MEIAQIVKEIYIFFFERSFETSCKYRVKGAFVLCCNLKDVPITSVANREQSFSSK